MTIRHLKIFKTVADLGGMSKAAKELHITQPSISQAIAELEKYYGVKLFERLSQKIYLTKEGELMLSFSRHILDSFEQMEAAMNQAVEKSSLRIGCSVSVGTCLIEEILDEAKERIPQCQISVIVTNSSEIEQLILTNEVDVGIVEGILKNKDLVITPVCEDELVLVCNMNHPLAKETMVTLDMLQGQDYASRESGSAERNQYEKLFEDAGLQLNRVFCSTNTEAIKNAVIHGRGIAVFSRRMVKQEVERGNMVVIPVRDITVKRNIDFVMHKNKYMSNEIQMMQKILTELKFEN